MKLTIKEQLMGLKEEKYKVFVSSLLPGKDNILGVRLPLLRKIAKEIVKEDWRTYVHTADNDYLEETLLQGMVIGYARAELEEILALITEYIPLIDNWSVCDSFCSGLKLAKDNKERVFKFLQPYLLSDREYEIRFGVVMLLDYYVTPDYAPLAFEHFDRIKHSSYYVMMAVAWAISMYYIKLPEETMEYLKNNLLSDVTYNKALQKIAESLKVDQETKKLIRSMKQK